MDTALIGGIVGGVIGILGGLIGTYFSVNNTTGSEERAFMIKASVVCWVAISIFLLLMFTLPSSHRQVIWIPYSILLPLGITAMNRGQLQIKKRQQEAEQVGDGDAEEAV